MRRCFSAVIAGVMLVAVGGAAAQADDSNAVVTYRQQVMNVVGATFSTLKCVAKAECRMEDKLVRRQAGALAFMASMGSAVFKEPTSAATVKTTAKAEIWTDWKKFEDGMKKLAEETVKLDKAVVAGDAKLWQEQLDVVGKTCKSCHDDYRTK